MINKYRNFLVKILRKTRVLHIAFCLLINAGFIVFDYYIIGGYKIFYPTEELIIIENVPLINVYASYIQLFCIFLILPTFVFHFLGFMLFDSIRNSVKLRVNPLDAPFICFRFATRGHYFELIQNNVNILKDICLKVGMKRFIIQVATETELPLIKEKFVKQTVIPKDYVTKSGALFKARVLQYCLEDEVNFLKDNDWIVHMDEETKASENSIKGILNFVCDGRYQIGFGLIIYLKENLLKNIIPLLDAWRVSDDLGKQRFQLKIFHRLIFECKGSFWVVQAGVERSISFNHGPELSITEDISFNYIATSRGYKFNFLEGEMYEMSPTTLWDMIQQRKRWIQGGYFVARSSKIPIRTKLPFILQCSGVIFSFFGVLPILLQFFFPIPYPTTGNLISSFLVYYMTAFHTFGLIKSFSYFSRRSYSELLLSIIINIICMVPNSIIGIISTFLAFTSNSSLFHIVKKDISYV